jgi:hypothetical protein
MTTNSVTYSIQTAPRTRSPDPRPDLKVNAPVWVHAPSPEFDERFACFDALDDLVK